MPKQAENRKGWKGIAAAVLLVLCAAAMLKTLLVGLEIDEEYALSIGYRLVAGDRLFYNMWEPHQLSALPAALFLWGYMTITGGTTGVLLAVRATMLVLKGLLAWWFYREFVEHLGRENAFLGALVLFVYTPKWFLGPDYISQQFHFTLCAFLCFWSYYAHDFRRPWLVPLGAVSFSLSILAFPQSVFAAPVLFIGTVLLGLRRGEPKLLKLPRGAVLLVLGCAVSAGAFVAYVLPGMGLSLLLSRASLILNDPQYNFTFAERMALLLRQAKDVGAFLVKPLLLAAALCAGGAVLAARSNRTDPLRRWLDRGAALWAGLALVLCLVRALRDSSMDERYYLIPLALAGLWFFCGNRSKDPVQQALFWLGYLPGMAAYVFILRSTLLGFAATFMYLSWPAFCTVLTIARQETADESEQDHPFRCGGALLLTLLAFLLACRLCLVLTTGWKPHNIWNTELQKLPYGPTAGTWADRETAEELTALKEALSGHRGEKILLTTGDVHGIAYLMEDGTLQVGQASVISSTDSDPRFAAYYLEFPEKTPDVILYNRHCVRELDEFHAWLEENLNITHAAEVNCGAAALDVLSVG